MTNVLAKDRRKDTQRRKQCEDGGGDWSDVAISQGNWHPKEAESSKERILP